MEPLLTCRSMEISFSGRAVVRDVSFSLQKGEILGIAGGSGSGKSSLLRACMGLLGNTGRMTRGEILFQGENISALPERRLRRIRGTGIGMVFQDAAASLCPVRTIGAQIWESLRAHEKISRAQAKERAASFFERLGLKETERIWNSFPFELSGGMNQRVCIAAAALLKPAVLLADEPTSALDAIARQQAAQELLRLRDRYGTAVVLVSHDIGLLSAMADTLLVIEEGRIAEERATVSLAAASRPDDARRMPDAALLAGRLPIWYDGADKRSGTGEYR